MTREDQEVTLETVAGGTLPSCSRRVGLCCSRTWWT